MYLCKDCYLEKNPDMKRVIYPKGKYHPEVTAFDLAVIEHRLPDWEYAQCGRKACCEKCGKETIVYG